MSFTAETRERTRPVLPLAAMVDVLFLLIIFFMTASVFREQELAVHLNLPAADSAQTAPGLTTQIVIHITDDNRIHLGPRERTFSELRQDLVQLHAASPNETVVIRADEQSSYGTFLQILGAAQRAGFVDFDLPALQPPE